MAVYVDDYQLATTVGGVTGVWSHLMADTDTELCAFAEQLGICRPSTHRSDVVMPRCGVTEAERLLAIAAGALDITVEQAHSLATARQRIEAEAVQIAEDALRCSA
jgi:hypothetical protein